MIVLSNEDQKKLKDTVSQIHDKILLAEEEISKCSNILEDNEYYGTASISLGLEEALSRLKIVEIRSEEFLDEINTGKVKTEGLIN